MRLNLPVTLVGIAIFFVLGGNLQTVEPSASVAKISMGDLEVADVAQAATADDIKRLLGAPVSHRTVPNVPQAPSGYSWNYKDLEFTFDAQGHRLMAVLTGPSRSTRRGLRVGQTAKQALALYGRPVYQDETHLLWQVAEDEDETLGMTIILDRGRVTTILLGEVIEY